MAQEESFIDSYGPDRRVLERRWAQTKRLSSQFLSNPVTLIGSVIVVMFVLMAILAPVLAPTTGGQPYQMPRSWGTQLAPPLSDGHLLGTTRSGGDIFYGIVWGSRLTIGISLGVTAVSVTIGVVIGSIAGFVGGWVDEVFMRIVDGLISIPATVLAIAIVTALGASYFNIGVALSVMLWGTYARILRGEIIHIKNEEYVDAARVTGVSKVRILVREVLPNSINPIFVQATLELGSVAIIASGLAFIGLAESGLAEWGRLTAQGQQDLIMGVWWTSLLPGAAIFLWAFAWNMIGDGLRDVLDPRMQHE